MTELQKIESFRYSLAVAETFDEIKLIKDATTSFAELARLQNMSLEKQNEVGLFRLEITAKIGDWLDENYPSNGASNHHVLGTTDGPNKMPVSKNESASSRLINREPELVESVVTDIIAADEIITPNKVAKKVRDILTVEAEVIETKDNFKTKTVTLYNLSGHEDEEINMMMSVLRNMTTFYNKKDFKGFKRWAESYLTILINEYEK